MGKSLQVLTFKCVLLSLFQSLVVAAPSSKTTPCGRYQPGVNREAKIVGGFNAGEGEFPWMVSFVSESTHRHFCGGMVINDRYIMSAAHCFYQNRYLEYNKDGSLNLKSLHVVLGEYSLKNASESTEVPMNLKRVHLHPNYDPKHKQNDIALIMMENSITMAPSVQPVCLPEESDEYLWAKDTKATVVGWGKLRYRQDYYDWLNEIDALRKVDVKIWDRQACVEKYKEFPAFPSDSFLCAGEHGKESCTGDSGGALMRLNKDNKWVAIGIVANGDKCGAHGRPGIYTLVSDFSKWIESNT